MKLDAETVDAIGLWSLRIALVVGAVVAALMDKDEAAGVMAVLCFFSFVFL